MREEKLHRREEDCPSLVLFRFFSLSLFYHHTRNRGSREPRCPGCPENIETSTKQPVRGSLEQLEARAASSKSFQRLRDEKLSNCTAYQRPIARSWTRDDPGPLDHRNLDYRSLIIIVQRIVRLLSEINHPR